MAVRTEGNPVYPLHVLFDDGEELVLYTPDEVGLELEWFDTEDDDDSAVVRDHFGRQVKLKVERLTLLQCELKET